MHVHSFPPVVDDETVLLVLGSMPGKVSLQANEYYAHPRNLFWSLMGSFLGFDLREPYEDRLRRLLGARIGLWDVLRTCTRESSLDSDIVEASIVTNDFRELLATHPSIRALFFNGAKAESVFLRHVAPALPEFDGLTLRRLPSTSPANASIPLERKREAWHQVVDSAREIDGGSRVGAQRGAIGAIYRPAE